MALPPSVTANTWRTVLDFRNGVRNVIFDPILPLSFGPDTLSDGFPPR
jgi:hypothetical protein